MSDKSESIVQPEALKMPPGVLKAKLDKMPVPARVRIKPATKRGSKK